MFFLDPSGNALEFKGFNDFSKVLRNNRTSPHPDFVRMAKGDENDGAYAHEVF